MAFKTATALRASADSTVASSVEVTVSADGTGFTLSSTSIDQDTVFKTLTITPGSASVPDEIGSSGGGSGTGATGGGSDQVFYLNDLNVTTEYTIAANSGASTVGPITISNGVILTVGNNSRLVIL